MSVTGAVVVDLGVGNLGNLTRAVARVGGGAIVSSDPARVAAARCLLLPGVGAFGPPREALRGPLEAALRGALDAGAWLLGICVGYQLLFEASQEFGTTDGLGLLPGSVTRLPDDVPLPHIGWNRLELATANGDGLLAGLPADPWVYFVHSFAPEGVPAELVTATALHGRRFPAVTRRGRILGTQFHPETSGEIGLRILGNFLSAAGAR